MNNDGFMRRRRRRWKNPKLFPTKRNRKKIPTNTKRFLAEKKPLFTNSFFPLGKSVEIFIPGMSVHFHLWLKSKVWEVCARPMTKKTIYKHCEMSAAERNVMEMNTTKEKSCGGNVILNADNHNQNSLIMRGKLSSRR